MTTVKEITFTVRIAKETPDPESQTAISVTTDFRSTMALAATCLDVGQRLYLWFRESHSRPVKPYPAPGPSAPRFTR